ncbi:MAG: hypothetical protein GY934_16485 [Gammaproteobacteria bacterium]|nr:hypothetical protein [Gammaproteobacteria bacterium]
MRPLLEGNSGESVRLRLQALAVPVKRAQLALAQQQLAQLIKEVVVIMLPALLQELRVALPGVL